MSKNSNSGFGSRREDRETVLGILYAAETQNRKFFEVLAEQPVIPESYVQVLVEGITERQSEIDALIEKHADEWRLDRMPAVDRALLRIAVYEIMCKQTITTATIINEAVELAGEYSTDKSKRFVNGLLSEIAEKVR